MSTPLVSYHPSGRARVRPDALPDILAWIAVVADSYRQWARSGTRGKDDRERSFRRAHKAYARHALRALDRLSRSLCTSCDHARWRRYRDAIILRAAELRRER